MDRLLMLVLFMTAAAVSFCATDSLYVDPAGSDSNPGTAVAPFRTLEQARDTVRARRRTGWLPPGGVTVVLREGIHRRDAPFELGPEDSGDPGSPITYCGYPGERAVISGARSITGWTALDTVVQLCRAPIPKGWTFRFLYRNGASQPLARLFHTDSWHGWPRPVAVGPVGPDGQLLTFRAGELEGLEGLGGQLEIDLLPVNFWNTISVLRDIRPAQSTARRHSTNPTTFWADRFQEGNYNLLNAARFIDRPGEWAVDADAGVVVWAAGTPIGPEDEILAPAVHRLLDIRGAEGQIVRHIRISDLEFQYTDRLPEDRWPDHWIKRQAELPDAMLSIENAEDLAVTGCTFTHGGSYAVRLERHAQRIAVVGNEMGYLGCGGVLLQGYGPGATDVNRDNVVSRNHIHHTGTGGYLHSAAVTLYQSGSNEISFNIIRHVPYAGIQICGANWDAYGPERMREGPDPREPGAVDSYGNARAQFQTRWDELPQGRASRFSRESFKPFLHAADNAVHHNIILEYLEVLSDGAPLYAWSAGMGNLFYRNLMKRRGLAIEGQKWVFGIYMDDNVDGAVLFENVVWAQADSGREFYNKGANLWDGNRHRFPGMPPGYDELLRDIVGKGMARGGWRGELPEEIARVIDSRPTPR